MNSRHRIEMGFTHNASIDPKIPGQGDPLGRFAQKVNAKKRKRHSQGARNFQKLPQQHRPVLMPC